MTLNSDGTFTMRSTDQLPRFDWTAEEVMMRAKHLGAEVNDSEFAEWLAIRLNDRMRWRDYYKCDRRDLQRLQEAFQAGQAYQAGREGQMMTKYVVNGNVYRAALAERLNRMYCNEDDVTPNIVANIAWEELEKVMHMVPGDELEAEK